MTLVIQQHQNAAMEAAIHTARREFDDVSTHMTGTRLKSTHGDVAAAFVKEIGNNARSALVSAKEQIGKAAGSDVAKAAIGALLTASA